MTMAGLPRLIRPMLVSLRHELPADEESYGCGAQVGRAARDRLCQRGTLSGWSSRNDKDMAAELPGARRARGAASAAPVILDGGDRGAAQRTPGLRPAASRACTSSSPTTRCSAARRSSSTCSTYCTRARTRCSGSPTRSAGSGWRRSAWTPPRSAPRRGTAGGARGGAGREHREGPGRPSAVPASRWTRLPPGPAPATGSEVKNVSSRKSSICGETVGEGRHVSDTIRAPCLVGIYDGDASADTRDDGRQGRLLTSPGSRPRDPRSSATRTVS